MLDCNDCIHCLYDPESGIYECSENVYAEADTCEEFVEKMTKAEYKASERY